MVKWRVVLSAVVGPIVGSRGPVPMHLILRDIVVSLTTPTAIELSVFIGEGGWSHTISIRVWCIGTIYLDVMKIAPSSAFATDNMTNLMI